MIEELIIAAEKRDKAQQELERIIKEMDKAIIDGYRSAWEDRERFGVRNRAPRQDRHTVQSVPVRQSSLSGQTYIYQNLICTGALFDAIKLSPKAKRSGRSPRTLRWRNNGNRTNNT